MKEYGEWLRTAGHVPAASFDAHFRFVAIHPSLTARLLMNLLVLRADTR